MEDHLNFRRLLLGFATFQSALLITMMSSPDSIEQKDAISVLLGISIPSTLAWAFLDQILERQKRVTCASYGYSGLFALVSSLSAVAVILWQFSHFATYAFVVCAVMWTAAIIKVSSWRRPKD